MKRSVNSLLAIVTVVLAGALSATADPLSSAFTYQGQLKLDGEPLNGAVNLVVRLCDASSGGNVLGAQTIGNVAVADGLFTVTLNASGEFGPVAFDGAARWLEIQVNGVTLTPRQLIAASPYALQTRGIRVDDSGRVGIANNSPDADLTIGSTADAIARSIKVSSANEAMLDIIADADNLNEQHNPSLLFSQDGGLVQGIIGLAGGGNLDPRGQPFNSVHENALLVGTSYSGSPVQLGTQSTVRMTVLPGGNVGIGTINPARPLSVKSTTQHAFIGIDSGDGAILRYSALDLLDRGVSKWEVGKDNQNRFYVEEPGIGRRLTILPGGFVGIGTHTPTAALTVRGVTAFPSYDRVMSIRNAADIQRWEMAIDMDNLWFGAASGAAFAVNQGGVGYFSGGLNVQGTTTTNILTITGGSDIAEPYNVNVTAGVPAGCAEALPGSVVSIDPNRIGELRISSRAYDTTVAGIISGANGIHTGLTLTQAGSVADGQHPVAMTGRVWCWCDADTGGAIMAGDLLTTADTPGHAMKAADRDRAGGATIGKAMSSLQSGKGLVLVLVNLQ